jgi:ferredoxin-fold anticodon binding domain-containing protein
MRKLTKVVGSTTPLSHILSPEVNRGKLPNVAKMEGFLQRGAKCKRSNVDYLQNLA